MLDFLASNWSRATPEMKAGNDVKMFCPNMVELSISIKKWSMLSDQQLLKNDLHTHPLRSDWWRKEKKAAMLESEFKKKSP